MLWKNKSFLSQKATGKHIQFRCLLIVLRCKFCMSIKCWTVWDSQSARPCQPHDENRPLLNGSRIFIASSLSTDTTYKELVLVLLACRPHHHGFRPLLDCLELSKGACSGPWVQIWPDAYCMSCLQLLPEGEPLFACPSLEGQKLLAPSLQHYIHIKQHILP